MSFIPIKNSYNFTPVITIIGGPFTGLTFEVNREFKQGHFLSNARQPEVSLFQLICLDTTKFVLLSVFTLKETSCPKFFSKSRRKCAKSLLPVDVRRSKTSLFHLKIMRKMEFIYPPWSNLVPKALSPGFAGGAPQFQSQGKAPRWRR